MGWNFGEEDSEEVEGGSCSLPAASVIVDGADGETIMPFGPALADVAEDHFTFQTAQSVSETALDQSVEARFKKLEELVQSLQITMEKVVPPAPKAEAGQQRSVGATAKPAARKAPEETVSAEMAHLDPAVVASALQAGISKEQLGQLGKLLRKDNRMQDAQGRLAAGKKKTSVSSETEDEEGSGSGTGRRQGLYCCQTRREQGLDVRRS